MLVYTRAVPAERIAENLAFINWTLLTALAIGSFGAVGLSRLRTSATRGLLTFTAACSAAPAAPAGLADATRPATPRGRPAIASRAGAAPGPAALRRSGH